MEQEIPKPWVQYFDELQGISFYYNPITKESQWTLPTNPVGEASPQTNPQTRGWSDSIKDELTVSSNGWEQYIDSQTGQYYYYNTITQKTQWSLPEELTPATAQPIQEQQQQQQQQKEEQQQQQQQTRPVSESQIFEQLTDPSTGKFYYVDLTSGNTTWELPAGATLKSPENLQEPQPPQQQPQPQQPQQQLDQLSAQQSKRTTYAKSSSNLAQSDLDRLQVQPQLPGHASAPVGGLKIGNTELGKSNRPILPSDLMQDLHKFRLEEFAHQHFNSRKVGFLRRTMPVTQMLVFEKTELKQPLLRLAKHLHKDSKNISKAILNFMGDRDSKMETCVVATSLVNLGLTRVELCDEIYLQIKKQCTENPSKASERKGWCLMVMCCTTFAPTQDLEGFLTQDFQKLILENDIVGDYAHFCLLSLKNTVAKKPYHTTFTPKDAERITRPEFITSQFTGTIDEIMLKQQRYFPDNTEVPHILTVLCRSMVNLGAKNTEGIFRLPAQESKMEEFKAQLENGDYSLDCKDPNIPACLLKLWFRGLSTPIIPESRYDYCIKISANPEKIAEFIKTLPSINVRILKYLCAFLREMSDPEVVAHTKMHEENLALVFAPNILRGQPVDPVSFYKEAELAKIFMLSLIHGL